jgi:phosphatidate cytidylyltransferase
VLRYRLITGPLLIAFLLGLVAFDEWVGPVSLPVSAQDALGVNALPAGLAIYLVGMLAVVLASRELAIIVRAQGVACRAWLLALSAGLALTCMYLEPVFGERAAYAALATLLTIAFGLSLIVYSRGHTTQGVMAATGMVLLVTVYVGVMLGFLLLVRHDHSAWWLVGIILTVKAGDTGAYFTGRAIGKHKLIPWLSPGKTWEGAVGGLIWAMGAGIGMAAASGWLADPTDHVTLLWGAVCGLALGAAGQFGDLAMSLFKRGAGVKDSSQILPGLGGIMDVLDSPLFVAPIAYWLLAGP